MCLQTACLSEEGLEFLESSFIARNRLQFEANRILHEAENRKTEIAKLSPFDALVVVKKVELHEVLWARQGSNSSRSERCSSTPLFTQGSSRSLVLTHFITSG